MLRLERDFVITQTPKARRFDLSGIWVPKPLSLGELVTGLDSIPKHLVLQEFLRYKKNQRMLGVLRRILAFQHT